jgi:hypothetical protein
MDITRNDFSNDSISFREHNEHMRIFRKSHADIAMTNAAPCGERPVPANTLSLQLSHIVRKKEGSKLLIGAEERSAIVPMWSMTTREFSQN